VPNRADFQVMAGQFCSPFNSGQRIAATGGYAENPCVLALRERWPRTLSRHWPLTGAWSHTGSIDQSARESQCAEQ